MFRNLPCYHPRRMSDGKSDPASIQCKRGGECRTAGCRYQHPSGVTEGRSRGAGRGRGRGGGLRPGEHYQMVPFSKWKVPDFVNACRYGSACKYKETCTFDHIPASECRYFLQGKCTKGAACAFAHPVPPPYEPPKPAAASPPHSNRPEGAFARRLPPPYEPPKPAAASPAHSNHPEASPKAGDPASQLIAGAAHVVVKPVYKMTCRECGQKVDRKGEAVQVEPDYDGDYCNACHGAMCYAVPPGHDAYDLGGDDT